MNNTSGAQHCQQQLSTLFFVIGIVIIAVIAVFGAAGNFLVCIAMARFPYLRRTQSNYLVLSLAISDLLVCVTVLPFDIIYWADFPRWTRGGYACNAWNALFYLLMAASVLNLITISLDRFVAIVYPLYFHAWVTQRTVTIAISAVWIYALGTGVVLFVFLIPPEQEYYSFDVGEQTWFTWYLLIVNNLIPFLIMAILYLKVYRIARGHARRIYSSNKIGVNGENKTFSDTIRRELRIAKALGIVIVCFILCWLPYQILNFMTLTEIVTVEDCSVELADTVTCWLAYLNSAINPVLYGYTNKEYRRAFQSILCSCTTGNSVHDYPRSSTPQQHRRTAAQEHNININIDTKL